ncbi:prepilin-type N-terminal cleavage/methylation domain-containing protein [Deinococcus apachensis]|uniref:prepilin-type N-terminal cleavage/methylation domain-containing protein n=1 Tax=Deinococcus apachensis TaxID=309886 RepID=UPI00036ADD69|nr:prepilin-type N-terminal cleavage/methylation domain-containing protein [Deinococcus apachensis]
MSPPRAQAGFTLLELLVVLGVLGILLSIAALMLMPWIQSQRIRSDLSGLAADFNLYRTKTMSEGVPYRLTLASDKYTVEAQNGTTWKTIRTTNFTRARLTLTNVATAYTFDTRGFANATLSGGNATTNTTFLGGDSKTKLTVRVTALGFARLS